MDWEVRFHLEAKRGLYRIERGIAGLVTDEIEALSKLDNPVSKAILVSNYQIGHDTYQAEIHGHFVTFQLWIDEQDRKVILIVSVE